MRMEGGAHDKEVASSKFNIKFYDQNGQKRYPIYDQNG